MVRQRSTLKQFSIVATALCLTLGTFGICGISWSPRISIAPAKVGQRIAVRVQYPPWHGRRFALWICPSGTYDWWGDGERDTGVAGLATRKWHGGYYSEAQLGPVLAPGDYDVYLTYEIAPPIDAEDHTPAYGKITVAE